MRTPIAARRPTSAKSTHRVIRTLKRSPRRASLLRPRDENHSIDFNSDSDNPRSPPRTPDREPRRPSRPSYAWDDETTLVSALIHDADPAHADPHSKLTALADALQGQFTRAGTDLLADMAHTLQPAVQRVTIAHRSLQRRTDPAFATGLLAFDDACKALEGLMIDDQRSLQKAFGETEARIKSLFVRLDDAYRAREQLWESLDAVLASTVDPALAALAEVPPATERTIAALEKHAKTLAAKDEDSGADKIRGMLAKFT